MVVLSIQPPEVDGGIPIYGYRIEYESRSQDFKLGKSLRGTRRISTSAKQSIYVHVGRVNTMITCLTLVSHFRKV